MVGTRRDRVGFLEAMEGKLQLMRSVDVLVWGYESMLIDHLRRSDSE